MLIGKSIWALALILSISLFTASAQAAIGKSGYSLRKQVIQQTVKQDTVCLEQDEKQYETKKRASARNHKTGIRR